MSKAKTTFHFRPGGINSRKRRRSWRTWDRCFCSCYDGSMFRPKVIPRRVWNPSRDLKPAATVECR